MLRKFTKTIFILLNVFVALAFLAGCYASKFDPEKYWYFGLCTLAEIYLLLFLIFFIIFWFFVRKGFILIGLLAMVIAWKPLGQMIRLRVPSTFSIVKADGNLRVMSWNVEHFDILEHRLHPERKAEMIALINKYKPDIACFQEMVGGDHDPSAINYVPDIAARLGFKDYYYSYNRKLDFDSKHHFGIILFSRYPIINQQTVSFPPNDYNSIFQYADIVRGTDTFRVFNIHLQSLKFSEENRQYMDDPSLRDQSDVQESKNIIAKLRVGFLKRKIQSERIRNEMDKSPYRVIVCGDFNDVPNSYAYATIGRGMKNCFAEKGSLIGRTFYSISPTLRIDNIFTDPAFTTTQFVRVKKKLSDHFPIIADLSRSAD